jgi:hypothetical protein
MVQVGVGHVSDTRHLRDVGLRYGATHALEAVGLDVRPRFVSRAKG